MSLQLTIFGITGLKTFLDVLFSIQFTAHLDEAGDVCGVVAGVGVLFPVPGVHGLTAAPTLATAWLEAAGPRDNPHRPPRAWDRRHQPDTGTTGEWRNKVSICVELSQPSILFRFHVHVR